MPLAMSRPVILPSALRNRVGSPIMFDFGAILPFTAVPAALRDYRDVSRHHRGQASQSDDPAVVLRKGADLGIVEVACPCRKGYTVTKIVTKQSPARI
jgi:hypothetical protein